MFNKNIVELYLGGSKHCTRIWSKYIKSKYSLRRSYY